MVPRSSGCAANSHQLTSSAFAGGIYTRAVPGQTVPQILAMGGGGFMAEPESRARRLLLLALSGASTAGLLRADAVRRLRPRDRGLLRGVLPPGLRAELPPALRGARAPGRAAREQDVVYVSGGNTANALALWRLHGIDRALRDAWDRGAVLGGVSAGANCWFEACVTDSFGLDLAPLEDGLALLPGSFCPHYDGEELRRPVYRKLVDGGLHGRATRRTTARRSTSSVGAARGGRLAAGRPRLSRRGWLRDADRRAICVSRSSSKDSVSVSGTGRRRG